MAAMAEATAAATVIAADKLADSPVTTPAAADGTTTIPTTRITRIFRCIVNRQLAVMTPPSWISCRNGKSSNQEEIRSGSPCQQAKWKVRDRARPSSHRKKYPDEPTNL